MKSYGSFPRLATCTAYAHICGVDIFASLANLAVAAPEARKSFGIEDMSADAAGECVGSVDVGADGTGGRDVRIRYFCSWDVRELRVGWLREGFV